MFTVFLSSGNEKINVLNGKTDKMIKMITQEAWKMSKRSTEVEIYDFEMRERAVFMYYVCIIMDLWL